MTAVRSLRSVVFSEDVNKLCRKYFTGMAKKLVLK
jgi:hypothetical protein